MTVLAFRSREIINRDERAAELPHRKEYADPTDQRIGSPLGKAVILGLITQPEFDIGIAWGSLHSEFIKIITDPDAYSDLRFERITARYNEGRAILEELPRRVLHAVMALAAYGEDWGDLEYTAATAKHGFDALSRETRWLRF